MEKSVETIVNLCRIWKRRLRFLVRTRQRSPSRCGVAGAARRPAGIRRFVARLRGPFWKHWGDGRAELADTS